MLNKPENERAESLGAKEYSTVEAPEGRIVFSVTFHSSPNVRFTRVSFIQLMGKFMSAAQLLDTGTALFLRSEQLLDTGPSGEARRSQTG